MVFSICRRGVEVIFKHKWLPHWRPISRCHVLTPLLVIVPWSDAVSALGSDWNEFQFILAAPLLARSRRSAMSTKLIPDIPNSIKGRANQAEVRREMT